MNSTSRPRNIAVGSTDRLHAELDRRGRRLDRRLVAVAGLLALGDPARRLRLRPLLVDGLVAGPQVLVDQRRAELGGVDRPGDGLDRAPSRA